MTLIFITISLITNIALWILIWISGIDLIQTRKLKLGIASILTATIAIILEVLVTYNHINLL